MLLLLAWSSLLILYHNPSTTAPTKQEHSCLYVLPSKTKFIVSYPKKLFSALVSHSQQRDPRVRLRPSVRSSYFVVVKDPLTL